MTLYIVLYYRRLSVNPSFIQMTFAKLHYAFGKIHETAII